MDCIGQKWVKTLILLLLISTALSSIAQDKKALKLFSEAKLHYNNGENQKALAKLDAAIKQDPQFVDALLLSADLYHEIDSTELQIEALRRAISIDQQRFPKVFYVLGNAYSRIGKYDEASEAYQQFLDSGRAGDLEGKAVKRIHDCDAAQKIMQNEIPFHPESLGDCINSEWDEYWPSLTIDGKTLIFTRLVPVENQTNELMPRFQEDFYKSEFQEGNWGESEPLLSVNTKQNEGAQSISADGKLIFFTACNQQQGFGSCDIYFTRLIQGQWTRPENAGAPVNSGSWESQPSISANGEYLYFVSSRREGHGGMDIWRCQLIGFNINGKPVWGKLENLGDSVNTSGNEMSPFIHADGATLYFASDYWPGLGGNDLFVTQLKNDRTWKTPLNLGYPINSYGDEQGMIVDASGESAYYSTDRPGSKGADIYRFKLYKNARPTPVSYVKGRVYDRKTGIALSSTAELMDIDTDQLVAKTVSSPDNGEFMMCLPLGKEYAFNVSRLGYLFYSENFSMTKVWELTDPFSLDIALSAIEMGNTAILRNIFFETDSYELLRQSQSELDKLIEFMQQNPEVTIEIGGHTDNVGTAEYNQILSENRAKVVYNYLVRSGIDESRLAYSGYGFDLPVASNETDEGRAKNRRTEFKIIGISN